MKVYQSLLTTASIGIWSCFCSYGQWSRFKNVFSRKHKVLNIFFHFSSCDRHFKKALKKVKKSDIAIYPPTSKKTKFQWLHWKTNFQEKKVIKYQKWNSTLNLHVTIFSWNKMWFLVSYLPTFSDNVTLFIVFFLKASLILLYSSWIKLFVYSLFFRNNC